MNLYITILIEINEVVGELLMEQMKRFGWNNLYRIHYRCLREEGKQYVKGFHIQSKLIEQMERKSFLNKPDDVRPIERVDVSFDFARSNTLTSNFISILLK